MKEERLRTVGLVLAGLLVGGILMSPATAHITDSFAHLWGTHIKEKTDKAYTGETRVVVDDQVTVDDADFGGANVFCPQGMEAIGGGIDPQNVLTMVVTASGPVWGSLGQAEFLNDKPEGTYRSATGWSAFVRNNSGGPLTARVAVICATK